MSKKIDMQKIWTKFAEIDKVCVKITPNYAEMILIFLKKILGKVLSIFTLLKIVFFVYRKENSSLMFVRTPK